MGCKMIYNGIELAQYPICDTDIWIDAVLGKLDRILVNKYNKLIVADVVEKEIMKFTNDDTFSIIAEKFLQYKNNQEIIVIMHSDINEIDRRMLEKQLVECDDKFETGLKDDPHEKNKGEIVSAIYAEHFKIPFLKSNDGIFREGNRGQVSFPHLGVKNLSDMLKDLVQDTNKRYEYYQLIIDNRALMDEGTRIYEESPVTEEQVRKLLNKLRSKL